MPMLSRRILISYNFKIPTQSQSQFQDAEQSAPKLKQEKIENSTSVAVSITVSGFPISSWSHIVELGGGERAVSSGRVSSLGVACKH
jgi:hypothetical protein